jgi:hypothetical protein
VLGPLLRYVDETAVTIWVETDRECQVETLGRQARTFEVAGHHYALVVIDGLAPGTETEYQVTLDGTVCWPEPDGPGRPSVLRTLDPGRPLRLAFGSCRIGELPARPRRRWSRARPGPDSAKPDSNAPDRTEPDRTEPDRTEPDPSHGTDALAACARDLAGQPPASWPDTLLLIGDQVYADDTGPATRQFIAGRRDPSAPPGYQVADFAEYCALYREAWTEPSVRWLLSVIPTAMIFDDHDVHDDWNISASWRRDYQAKPWWPERISAAFQTYWIYQHLGNLSPAELAKDELWRQVTAAPGDAAALLRDFAKRADQPSGGVQWSFARSCGQVRIVAIDSRAGRVLDNGRRRMIGAAEWDWVTRSVAGDWDHVVLATSLPLLLPAGIHGVEAWSEAVCDGAWGKRFARVGERIRGPGALGRLRRVVRRVRAAAGRAGDRDARPAARLGHGDLRRHPSQLPGAGRLPGRDAPAQCRLPGGLLANPQSAPGVVPAHAEAGHLPGRGTARHRARPAGPGSPAGNQLADHPRPVVPQHALRPGIRRPRGPDPLRRRRPGNARLLRPRTPLRNRAQP